MSTTIVRVRKNLLGETEPATHKKEVRDLLQDSYFNKINSHPVYQRNIKWSPDAMNDFISTIMNNGLVPGIIMYQLSSDEKVEKNDGKVFEMVDGQHRLFTLRAFMESTLQILPHIKKPFIVHWNYDSVNEDGIIQQCKVFYKETIDVAEWCCENKITPQYLTEDEKLYFDGFGINLMLIRSKLSVNDRREIFMKYQKGIPVRNSDFLKNKTDCKLVAFMSDNNYEDMMTNVFFEHCHKKAANYWVHWASRCFLLYNHFSKSGASEKFNTSPVSEIFLFEDKKIKILIDRNSLEFNPSDITVIHNFDDVFRAFIGFLQKFEATHKLNPTQIFALFYVLCDESKNLDYVLSHIPNVSNEGLKKEKKTMWESKDERQPRREYFTECVKRLTDITDSALPYDYRQISKSIKKQVWAKCVDSLCEICEEEIDKDKFEAGHITSRALGGQVTIDNLIPICFECNRSMGTRNAYEYKRDVYPQNIDV
jgi:hypothetical protein